MAFGVNLRKSSRENDLFADAVYFSSFLIKSIGYDWEWGTPYWRSWWNVEFVFISDKPLQNAATPNNMSLAVNNYQQGKVQKTWNLSNFSYCGAPLVNCPTQPTCIAHCDLCICQLSRRWQPSLALSKMFEPSHRPWCGIWVDFFCKICILDV